MTRRPHSTRFRLVAIAPALMAAACSDPAPPEPEVADIVLSVPDTGATLGFRDWLIVIATPQAALGVPLARHVSWQPWTALVAIEPLNNRGDSVRLRPTGVGTGAVRVLAGAVTRTFRLTVTDTVYSVSVTPGALALVAGDTASFKVTVDGPPSASSRVDWEVTNGTVLQELPSLDPTRVSIQATRAGTTVVQAIARADPTKVGQSTVSIQTGKLAFVVQPTTTSRELPFSPSVTVELLDAAGSRSARATNAVRLSMAPGSCTAALTREVQVNASSGQAQFPRVAVNARCGSARVEAIAVPFAEPVTSEPFQVTARGCDVVVPYQRDAQTSPDTVDAVFEAEDCAVTRNGSPFHAHTYSFTVPSGSTARIFNVNVDAAPGLRVESRLWSADSSIYWVDSSNTAGRVRMSYALAPGLYRFVVTRPASPGPSTYTITSSVPNEFLGTGTELACRLLATPGLSVGPPLLRFLGGECEQPFATRPGQRSIGREFVLHIPAGKSHQVTLRPANTAVFEPYLEVFDVTNGSAAPALLVAAGRVSNGTDAQLTIAPAPTGRLVLIRAAQVGDGTGQFGFSLAISP